MIASIAGNLMVNDKGTTITACLSSNCMILRVDCHSQNRLDVKLKLPVRKTMVEPPAYILQFVEQECRMYRSIAFKLRGVNAAFDWFPGSEDQSIMILMVDHRLMSETLLMRNARMRRKSKDLASFVR